MVESVNAVQRFEDHKDNPIVQTLTSFIILNLGRSLSEVVSWGVEVSDKRTRAFYLRFTDGTKMSGELEEVWIARVFERSLEKQESETV